MSVVIGGITNVQAQFNQTPASGIFAGTSVALPPQRFQSYFKNGTAPDQIDGLSAQLLTFAASTPQVIDLATLADFQGNAITAARVTFIAFKNLSQVDNDFFLVGDAGTDEFDGFLSAGATMKVFPSSPTGSPPVNDGFVILSAPGATAIPIGPSNYNLKIDPGTLAKQMILLIGTRSA